MAFIDNDEPVYISVTTVPCGLPSAVSYVTPAYELCRDDRPLQHLKTCAALLPQLTFRWTARCWAG